MRSSLLGLVLLASGVACAGTVTLTWSPASTCSDGSALTNCAATGFNIYGALSGQPKTLLASAPATDRTRVLSSVAPGNWCYDMTTLAGALESAHSAQSCKVVPPPIPPPNPPTITTIDAIAYQINPNAAGTLVAARVGVIDGGPAPCLAESQTIAGVKYNRIDTEVVDLTNIPIGILRGFKVWAHCAPSSG